MEMLYATELEILGKVWCKIVLFSFHVRMKIRK
jgi:hypothetical protein